MASNMESVDTGERVRAAVGRMRGLGIGVREGEPMAAHTSMRCGGAAAAFAEPRGRDALALCAAIAEEAGAPYFLLGCGTNVLVRDSGYEGIVISVCAAAGADPLAITVDGDGVMDVPAGVPLAAAARRAAQEGLSGLEPLSGIPGSVGGAACMNAGAYGSEMSDIVRAVLAYSMEEGRAAELGAEECGFAYRDSAFRKGGHIVLGVRVALARDGEAGIRARMADYAERRREKQPVECPSAGSFFKRPPGDFAARLIDEAGLRGYAVGGARVSEKHAGFIVNAGGATASDVLAAAAHVKRVVFEKSGILLEEEPVILGRA